MRADRIQLFRVLTNLMRNAAEAGAQERARLGARTTARLLAIEIADDGPGLPEAVRADLFRPFAGSMRRGGTGLGLAIARDLMVAHGGDIELLDDRRRRNHVPPHPAARRTGAQTADPPGTAPALPRRIGRRTGREH